GDTVRTAGPRDADRGRGARSSSVTTWPGRPYPLGATWDGRGTNVAVFSEAADAVEVCLFGRDGDAQRIELRARTASVWHAALPGVGPGTRYGFRVHGPWDPANGKKCNPAKLLIDPYAKAIDGDVQWHPACFGFDPAAGEHVRDTRNSAPYVPKSV